MSAVEAEDVLFDQVAQFKHDPMGYVLFAFPWGEPGELENEEPEAWQAECLEWLGAELRAGHELAQLMPILLAMASGHGIGKSALVAWIILWAMSTCDDCRGVVTANTENQLRTKTWAELAKWHRLCINAYWFKFTATALFAADPEHAKTWRIDMVPWSETNTEAFAGLHNKGRRIVLIFDEGSAISDVIWEVAEGALTDKDTEIIWACFGNPTRNRGRFRECFRKFRHRWHTKQIDSRTVRLTNKEQIAAWEKDHGEDSDFFKVRVRGVFPSMSIRQFISEADIDKAWDKHLRKTQYNFAPKVIGVDPAWTGDDEFVISIRQGLHSQILGVYDFNDNDIHMARILAGFEDDHEADAVFIDAGHGTGIKSAGDGLGRSWTLVWFGGKSPDPGCRNMRAYIWREMKHWLKNGGAIPPDDVLRTDLAAPETVPRPDGIIQLESKEDMRRRSVPSPNRADALALTFAAPVQPRHTDDKADHDFDPYS